MASKNIFITSEDNKALAIADILNDKFSDSTIYIMNAPISKDEQIGNYETDNSFIVLIPSHKIFLVKSKNDTDEVFENYKEDLFEDITHLSKTYDYQTNVLDRIRELRPHCFEEISDNEYNTDINFFENHLIKEEYYVRQVNLIISLLTGSINSLDKVGDKDNLPQSTLEKIKREIVLYDTDQTRFISDELNQDRVVIQGVSGSGKTELLLHKLVELYTERSENNRIAFTCFNKSLASSLNKRVPEFFDFMKVSEQIKWDERLWVMHSWGSRWNLENPGIYAEICRKYGLTFYNASEKTFDEACKIAMKELNEQPDYEPLFDYMLIDESQDFEHSFFDLCEMITKKGVYIAGDVFQDIFQRKQINTEDANYNLSTCYRTDPRTLMIAHAIGFGIFEETGIRKLTKDNWVALGYDYQKENSQITLTRKPIRKFNSINDNKSSSEIIGTSKSNIKNKILEIIQNIKDEHGKDLSPNDIAVISLDRGGKSFENLSILSKTISNYFGIPTNTLTETKEVDDKSLVVSNINNIKGLEFPFVILYSMNKISGRIGLRNSIYMAMTRSYLKTYMILDDKMNDDFISIYSEANKHITKNSSVVFENPSSYVDPSKLNYGHGNNPRSHNQILTDFFNKRDMDLDRETEQRIRKTVFLLVGNSTDVDKVELAASRLLEQMGGYFE